MTRGKGRLEEWRPGVEIASEWRKVTADDSNKEEESEI